MWEGPKNNVTILEKVVRLTIGIALKSQHSESYIEQLMTLDEESQCHLGEVVEECMEAIYEGTSSQSSTASGAATSEAPSDLDSSKLGRGFDAEDPLPGSESQMSEDERKFRNMQKQALIAERECLQLRDKNTVLERDVALLRTECDTL